MTIKKTLLKKTKLKKSSLPTPAPLQEKAEPVKESWFKNLLIKLKKYFINET